MVNGLEGLRRRGLLLDVKLWAEGQAFQVCDIRRSDSCTKDTRWPKDPNSECEVPRTSSEYVYDTYLLQNYGISASDCKNPIFLL